MGCDTLLSRGEYRSSDGRFGLIVYNTKQETEVILVLAGNVWSSYKVCETGEFSYGNKKAKEAWKIIQSGLKGCTAKNGSAAPFVQGTVSRHKFTKSKIEYIVDKFNGELAGAEIKSEQIYCYLEYYGDMSILPKNIPYVKLVTAVTEFEGGITEEEAVVVRSLEEIALEKDLTWLKDKKYYIVNDVETAEKIFTYLESYNGPISYDTETTGLRINMFGKVNSQWQKQLEEYNNQFEDPRDKIRVDKLVGFIFSIEPNVAYYFPVANRKFTNLYEDKNSVIMYSTIQKIKAQKLIDDPYCVTDMGRLLRDTPNDKLTPDVIAMERVRKILETKHIVAHNGAFEWKVDWLYEIDTNLKDDTMILHQLMYKFRSTTSNRGEPSNLKYLEKREYGIDSLELDDFFPDYKEDESGAVRAKNKKKQKGSRIDFSYMTYDGARAYAPADGDWTLQLFYKYKRDLIENHKELEYLYSVEVLVACAIGYMEFYGHRLDENKIEEVKKKNIQRMTDIEEEIRIMANIKDDVDVNKLLSSPAQVAKLFFETMQIPFNGEKMSVAKKEIKPLLKMKNEDGTEKYKVVHLYSEWKKLNTLLTKFFDNLQYFMYPGGFIFSSYGQISTATGRMSCSKPNAQQYPKDVTGIVVPRAGYVMMDCDYSQIEYRTLVALAKETGLLEQFYDPDMDYHTMMASLMYSVPYASVTPKMRSDAKSFNFGIPYGMGFKSLAILLTGMSGAAQVEEAKEKYELYFKDQPNVRVFFDYIKELAQVNRYTKTYWNRYRYYSFTDKDGNISHKKKASALRQAGNAVIQGTAADIFKISVARNFMYIRINKLYGQFLIVNMVHDEQLFEVNCQTLNTQRILRDVAENMEFKVEGFPPLYIGAGIGPNWKSAKGKNAEIHPVLCEQLSREADNMSVYASTPQSPEDVIKYFDNRVFEFRKQKIINYLMDSENYGKDLHPVIGNLLNLQFTFGLEKSKDNPDGLEGDALTLAALAKFIEVYELNVNPNNFQSIVEQEKEIEEDTEYEDDEEEEDEEGDVMDNDFALIDEDDTLYGVSLQEVIKLFGLIISQERRVCGIDITVISYKKKEELIEYLAEHQCAPEDEGAVQAVFLRENNVLFETGVWVKDISGSAIAAKLKLNSLMYN